MRTKKLFSILLCIVIFLGALAVGVHAKTFFLGTPPSPTVDGQIGDDEYTWTSGQFDRLIGDNQTVENTFYTITPHTHKQWNDTDGTFTTLPIQFWAAYDQDYVYLAFKERGNFSSTVLLDVNPCIGKENTGGQITFLVQVSGSNGTTSDIISNITTRSYSALSTYEEVDTSTYVEEAKLYSWDDTALGVNYVELKIKRSALCEYAGVESIDKLGFRSMITSQGEYFYADLSSPYGAWGSNPSRGFHVLNFEGVPAQNDLGKFGQKHFYVEKATAENTPVTVTVDGAITAGEYNFYQKTTFTNNVPSNDAFKIINTADTVNEMELYVTHDDNYVYLGVKIMDTNPDNGDYFYINIPVGNSMSNKVQFYLPYYGIDNGTYSNSALEVFAPGAVDLTTFVEKVESSKIVGGYVHEIAVKKSALVDYANSCDGTELTSIDEIFFMPYLYVVDESTWSQTRGFVFGFTDSSIMGNFATVQADAYAHVLSLSAGEACETHSYETGEGAYVSDTQHKVICTVCGAVSYEDHALVATGGTEPTYTQAGALTYACEAGLCQGKYDPQVPALGIPEDRHLLTLTAQQHNFVSKATAENSATPTVDGVITPGEYNWAEKNITTNKTTENITDYDLYFTYDDTYVYIGAVVTDASEHVNYKQAIFAYVNGGDDISDAWKIYLTRANGTNVEHWEAVDGAVGSNLWTPTKGFTYKLVQNGDVYTYELALNRADWGLSGDTMYFMAVAQSANDGKIKYGFTNDELYSSIPMIDGAYPHAMFLGEKSAFATDLAETDLAYTACENHTNDFVESYDTTNHKMVCSVCGAVTFGEHNIINSEETKAPGYGTPGIIHHTCAYCIGYDEETEALALPSDMHLLTLTAQQHNFVAAATEANSATPTVDGVLNEDEYNWFVKGIVDETSCPRIENVDIYFTYDNTNVYFGILVDDPSDHVAYQTCARIYVNGGDDISDAWNIYLTRNNGTNVEHWQITDGSSSANLWTPEMGFTFKQSQTGGVYTYEISLNRADWGLDTNKMYFAVKAISGDGSYVSYSFKDDALSGIPSVDGLYPNVMFLGEKSVFADYLAGTSLAYTACENHTYGATVNGDTYHK